MASKKINFILSLIKLTKPVISLAVAFSALTAFILYSGSFSPGWLSLYLGVLLTAAGSSAINQIQEAESDKLMRRTKTRPIPGGKISIATAWGWSLILFVSGFITLLVFSGLTAASLSLITLLWYNGIYTPLKKISPWAIIPGAVVGALPPAIGWVAAGGYILHPSLLFLSFFFFIGQVPHFWLILLKYDDDYKKAGFPSISTTFSKKQIVRLTFTWTLATSLAAILLTLFNIIVTFVFSLTTIIISLALVIAFASLIKNDNFTRRAFAIMNMYFFIMMLIIIGDALIR